MGNRAATGVSDEHEPTVGLEGVDHPDDRVNVIVQADIGAVGILRLHARQRERMRAMTRILEDGHHVVPRRPVEPDSAPIRAEGWSPGVPGVVGGAR